MATGLLQRAPSAAGQMLSAADMQLGPVQEIVVIGDQTKAATGALLSDLNKRYLPNRVTAVRAESGGEDSPHLQGLFAGKSSEADEPTVYICQDFACAAPGSGRDAVHAALDALVARGAP
jgi:uncharacterized protein YyaL (SSP411 family)